MEKIINILCTRLLKEHLKNEANNKGIQILDQNFVQISYNDQKNYKRDLVLNNSPLLFTSVHGIKACLSIFEEKIYNKEKISCYCINGATSNLATSIGFNIIAKANNASELGEIIIHNNEKKLLHCTTNLRRTDIYDQTKSAGISIIPCEVYYKELQFIETKSADGILFYAPSQIDAFFLANKLDPKIPAFCIGPTTANHLVHLHHQNIIIAKTANTRSLLEEVYKYYN